MAPVRFKGKTGRPRNCCVPVCFRLHSDNLTKPERPQLAQLATFPKIKRNIKSTGTGTESNWSSVLGKLPQLDKLEPGLYLPFSRVSVLFVLLTARSYSCVKYVTSRVRKRDTTCDVSSFQWKQFQISFLFHFAVARRATLNEFWQRSASFVAEPTCP